MTTERPVFYIRLVNVGTIPVLKAYIEGSYVHYVKPDGKWDRIAIGAFMRFDITGDSNPTHTDEHPRTDAVE